VHGVDTERNTENAVGARDLLRAISVVFLRGLCVSVVDLFGQSMIVDPSNFLR
jgi:hypothetical protein